MKKALGILGGMGPMATVDLFHKIVAMTDAACDNGHMRIYIDCNAAIPDRTAAILSGGRDPLPYMRESLQKLLSCGAELIIMPCNTAHYFLPRLQAESPVPFLSMPAVTAGACARLFPGKTAAILATRGTLATGIYRDALLSASVPFLEPDEAERDALMRVIYQGVKADAPAETYRADLEGVIRGLQARGADYFILGCTELPLAFSALKLSCPVVDPTSELARAAILQCGYQVRVQRLC